MIVDPEFLADVSALAEFVACLDIDDELRGRCERVRCDVHDMRKTLAVKEEKRVLRDSVRIKAYAEAT